MARLTWREATEQALYGEHGFFRRPEGPAAHFRTSVSAGATFAEALVRLARSAGCQTVADMGAGRGELLLAMARADRQRPPGSPPLDLLGVEVVPRPPGLPAAIAWASRLPPSLDDALVVANEWLDDVPCEVVQQVDGQWRLVLVDPATGRESIGPRPCGNDEAWLRRWWPLGSDGDRAEVGRARDEAWAALLRRLGRGVAVAVDYAHSFDERASGRWAAGSLCGYRDGQAVLPVPDGGCDITAHVAMDAVAAAGVQAGASATRSLTQRQALDRLDVAPSPAPPPRDLARTDPAAYLRLLARRGEAGELRDPAGLGRFTWLVQSVGRPLPPLLAG